MPYSLLDERSRRVGRESVREAVCTLLAYGYSLEPLNQERGMSQIIILSVVAHFNSLLFIVTSVRYFAYGMSPTTPSL